MSSSRKVLCKSICEKFDSNLFKIFLLLIILTLAVILICIRTENRIIVNTINARMVNTKDANIVKEFLDYLETRQRKEALKNEKELKIKMKHMKEIFTDHSPQVSDYFHIPKNIFSKKWLGEYGIGVKNPRNVPDDIQKIIDDGYAIHKFNQYLSDVIPIKRSLPDKRSSRCMKNRRNYRKQLPSTSIIIIFHNEAWSTLLRSVHSILDRTPHELIHEIILVDDCSTFGNFILTFFKVNKLIYKIYLQNF